jgi:hypothetical protein
MDEMRCSECKRKIYVRPCPYCGCKNVIYDISIKGQMDFRKDTGILS